jgi:signal transduction histidine kinase
VSPFEILSEVPYFSDLPEEELVSLCRAAEIIDVGEGEVVIREGDQPDALLVIADGTFEAYRQSPDSEVIIGLAGRGEVLGEMSLLEGRLASASLRALSPASLVRVPGERFQRLLTHNDFLRGMLLTVIKRMRQREGALVEYKKLAALGTMAAGLLHEVNNPAAAIKRSAAGLVEASESLVDRRTVEGLTPLQRANREDELSVYIEELGVEQASDLASSVVKAGWDRAALEKAGDGNNSEVVRVVRLIHARQLAEEVAMAAGRLSDLVGAVKSWVYLDQGTIQSVDLNVALDQTMALLRHKLSGISVDLDLDPKLPSIEARGAELNQVLTNIIDNAIQAAKAVVKVKTFVDGDHVVCQITDDGPGIPDEALDHIWEPFFTTKPPGQGTGLGLSISRRIVESHRGRLEVSSVPGATSFTVRLPLKTP